MRWLRRMPSPPSQRGVAGSGTAGRRSQAEHAAWQARVAHLESLHAHDAVASVSGRNG